MIYTSYFGNMKNFPDNVKPISIARWQPKWLKDIPKCLSIAPLESTLSKYKNGLLDETGYDKEYKEQVLAKKTPEEFLTELEQLSGVKDIAISKKNHIVLLCYEKDGDFCHRHLFSSYMNKYKIPIKELKKEDIELINRWNHPEKYYAFIADSQIADCAKEDVKRAIDWFCKKGYGIKTTEASLKILENVNPEVAKEVEISSIEEIQGATFDSGKIDFVFMNMTYNTFLANTYHIDSANYVHADLRTNELTFNTDAFVHKVNEVYDGIKGNKSIKEQQDNKIESPMVQSEYERE